MKRVSSGLQLSATDIAAFSACSHATSLDLEAVHGVRPRAFRPDAYAAILKERGIAHERTYLAELSRRRTVEEFPPESFSLEATLSAMARGVDVIYQGTLHVGRWLGRPDFLHRVDSASPSTSRWPWSYEVADAKLARSAKASALLQMCFYSELLSELQGVRPARMSLVLGDMRQESFLTAHYDAYFRYVRRCLEDALAAPTPAPTYPEPVEHCRVCSWLDVCKSRRREDDHLSLVAGITSRQRRLLEDGAVRRVEDLAKLPLDRGHTVQGIGFLPLTRIREQARIQVEGRTAGKLLYELLAGVEEGHGLGLLPAPSPGDLFIDFEGDPYAPGDGLDYLLGIAEGDDAEPTYHALWAFDRAGERAAFEKLIDIIVEGRARHPGMHVYHYNHTERTTMQRLAGRHATRIDALDELLRARVMVDLYAVVRQGVRASVESYSIKRLEPLYGFERSVPLREAGQCMAAFEAWVELRQTETPHDELRQSIEGYNRDDCVSALRLRTWLEARRTELEARDGKPLPRPAPAESKPSERTADEVGRLRPVIEGLLAGVPGEPEQRSEDEQARYVLAHLLEWHRREEKSSWWEYYRLCELPERELRDDKTAIEGLTPEGEPRREKRSFIHRYRFPPQDHAIDRARKVHDPRTESSAGTLVFLDDAAGILELSRDIKSTVPHPTALIPENLVPSTEQRASLLRLGEHVLREGLTSPGPFCAAIALLRRAHPPPIAGDAAVDDRAIAAALAVDGSILPVQGPPGTGKTYQGARMIVALLRAGKRVGITANSHKVITHLLDEACHQAQGAGVDLRAVQKGDEDDATSKDPAVTRESDNKKVVQAITSGQANVVAGTSWLWSRLDMMDKVDVLLVDEAGQMALANVLACAPAARGVILLGDPQQLDQPQKGVHPPGTSASALGHILGSAATLAPEQGLFLDETWRMHPDVCRYISEVFYEGKLRSRADLSNIRLTAAAPLDGTGLRFVPVTHRNNRSESIEEAHAVRELVDRLLADGTTWTDKRGATKRLALADILVVAPYNAHVALLGKHVPGAHVGTVDKFQGQEAPVVIYSMATSTPEDAPRGPEFLYSGNRLDVAISRARCAAFLVASPALFEMRCTTPRHMALMNAFCRYLELAREVRLAGC